MTRDSFIFILVLLFLLQFISFFLLSCIPFTNSIFLSILNTFLPFLFLTRTLTFFSYSVLSCRADYQYNPRGSSASVKKRILITHNLRLLKIKTKDYGKGQTLHNFMLEEVIIFIPVFVSFCLFLLHQLLLFWHQINHRFNFPSTFILIDFYDSCILQFYRSRCTVFTPYCL